MAGLFYDKFRLYKAALLRADSIISKVLQKPFDYTSAETINRSVKKTGFNFSADLQGLVNRWSRYPQIPGAR